MAVREQGRGEKAYSISEMQAAKYAAGRACVRKGESATPKQKDERSVERRAVPVEGVVAEKGGLQASNVAPKRCFSRQQGSLMVEKTT